MMKLAKEKKERSAIFHCLAILSYYFSVNIIGLGQFPLSLSKIPDLAGIDRSGVNPSLVKSQPKRISNPPIDSKTTITEAISLNT